MAQNKKNSKSEGLFSKIFRSRISRIPHRPQDSISNTSEKKPLSKTTVGISKEMPEIPSVRTGEKSASRKKEVKGGTIEGKNPSTRLKKEDDGKFSDYISKVKNRMMKTVSTVGGRGRISPRRDSFNDKVTNYINRAKIKISKTTNAGVKAQEEPLSTKKIKK